MTEEAVMKRLTAEEIAELEHQRTSPLTYGDQCRYAEALVENGGALLAMASRLVEVESALDFFDSLEGTPRGAQKTGDPVGKIFWRAKALGWTSPTQKQGDR